MTASAEALLVAGVLAAHGRLDEALGDGTVAEISIDLIGPSTVWTDVVLGNPLPTSLDGGEWRIVAEGRLQPHRRALCQTPATTSVVAAANRNVRTSSRSSAATAAVRTGTTSCTRDARQRDSPPSAAYQSV